MSYILDALRKADQERRRGGVPTLSSATATALAVERHAWLPYGLLAVLLLGLGIAIGWRYPGHQEPPPARASLTTPAPAASPRALAGEPPKARAQTGSGQEVAATASTVPSLAPSIALPTAQQIAPPMAASAPPVVPKNAPEEKLISRAELPVAMQQELPPLSVALHAYSSQAKSRLVSIDGKVLREGDSLTPELKLEQITPEGMIFSFRGIRFQHGIH